MTDLELLHRYAQRGQREDIEEIVRRFHALVYSVCWRHLKHRQQAEDATQEVFLLLVKQCRRIRSHVGGWLYRCAYHTAVNAVRKQKVRRKGERQHAEFLRTLTDQRDEQELIGLVDECLAQLPAAERDLIVANILEETSQRELAAERGVSQQAVGKQLAKSFDRLRGLLRRRGVPLAIGALVVQLRAAMVSSASAAPAATLTSVVHQTGLAATTTLLPTASAKLAVAVLLAATMVTVAPRPASEDAPAQPSTHIASVGSARHAPWQAATTDFATRDDLLAIAPRRSSAAASDLRVDELAGVARLPLAPSASRRAARARQDELPAPPTGEAGRVRSIAIAPAPGASPSTVVARKHAKAVSASTVTSWPAAPIAVSSGGAAAAVEPSDGALPDFDVSATRLAQNLRRAGAERTKITEPAERNGPPAPRRSERPSETRAATSGAQHAGVASHASSPPLTGSPDGTRTAQSQQSRAADFEARALPPMNGNHTSGKAVVAAIMNQSPPRAADRGEVHGKPPAEAANLSADTAADHDRPTPPLASLAVFRRWEGDGRDPIPPHVAPPSAGRDPASNGKRAFDDGFFLVAPRELSSLGPPLSAAQVADVARSLESRPDGDAVGDWFAASNPPRRDANDIAMPRLAEVFSDAMPPRHRRDAGFSPDDHGGAAAVSARPMAVPEPSTAVLLGLALLSVAFLGRKACLGLASLSEHAPDR